MIRRATIHDASALASFGARAYDEQFARDNDPADMAAYLAKAFGEAQQRRELEHENYVTLVAEENGAMIAFAQLRRGQAPSCVRARNPIEILRFYVDRPWHGRGVAQALMREAQNVARSLSADVLWLGVWERNPRAIAFYEKAGFRDVGWQPFLLGSDLQTDRVMVRELQDP